MSSDDDSDFLSSSDDLSDDDQTLKVPSGGSGREGARPAKCTPAAGPAKANPPTTTATAKGQPQGNLLTDLFQYVIFQDDVDHPRALSREREEETTPLFYDGLGALKDRSAKTLPPDYGNLTPPASVDTTLNDHSRADDDSVGGCHCLYHQDHYCEHGGREGKAKRGKRCGTVFKMLFMVFVLILILVLALHVFRVPKCGEDMYGFEEYHWWCFEY